MLMLFLEDPELNVNHTEYLHTDWKCIISRKSGVMFWTILDLNLSMKIVSIKTKNKIFFWSSQQKLTHSDENRSLVVLSGNKRDYFINE